MNIKQQLRRVLWRPYQAVRRVLDRGVFEYRYTRRSDVLSSVPSGWTKGETVDDSVLVDRIIASYQGATEKAARGNSMWRAFFHEYHREIDAALILSDKPRVTGFLRDPASCDLFYGFDNLSKFLLAGKRLEDSHAPAMALDSLLAFAEAIGVRRLENPEGYGFRKHERPSCDEVLAALDNALGVTLPVPNPYPREFGALTSRGILSYRAPHAMYQAWRLKQLGGGRILEIGAGLGRTALYAHALGITDYTIVDIPISTVAQGYFLGRTVGEVALSGETRRGITIRTPEEFFAEDRQYDIVLNADSLTELDKSVARDYAEAFKKRARMLFSINHESNGFTVNDLFAGFERTRTPSWTRRGYVEELVQL